MRNAVITGSGHFLPENIIENDYFLNHTFFDEKGEKIQKSNQETIQKFEEITEIKSRRYAEPELQNSDMAAIAGGRALQDAGVDKETLDYVIVASNYGNISHGQGLADVMPSMSARVKNKLGIKNNACRPYDMTFGCPGFNEALILATQFIKAGLAEKILVIGSDMISRAVDPYDRTAMIFADGAGAVILENKKSDQECGVLHYLTISDNLEELDYLTNGPSLNTEYKGASKSVSMKGRKVYEYALKKVPAAMHRLIEQAGVDVKEIKKILLHQANAKMDHAMVKRFYKLNGISDAPKDIAPMTVQDFGNSSVATVPTMFDLVRKNQLGNHQFYPDDKIILASVGAGMNINALLYHFPAE
ncbi:3-oxoacyl-[acyl-carrier-protein] synthase 3 [Candidatus Ornithobacterium hominis]|uniref:3-oxoacyl-ACP synthase III family protein n=1 Tax=Candidatus Ornithobacterium hominis TaxID=2497989 RepID=UPI000E5B91EC|nr:ketoacyl-ACP synthase III [Candidatus Ornithobacterium hominis]CAI9429182.1 3-oxoacyl-[acyl-carrier-protein] synthase 3 [Candidatus Ornithobacterium hominis]SZD72170.1 3-oxoacyl-[acyl-carrier-protein] synthase 3 [Candidatus Ornithobacterium hominis]